jgi:hypothetical protein
MPKLVPLTAIPSVARGAERASRAAFASRREALESAVYRIDVAPGCHGRPYFDPPVIGWVCSPDAARAMTEQMTRMPGGTVHRRLTCDALKAAVRNEAPAMTRYRYDLIDASSVPSDLRWDVPQRNQGQIVEVAYADHPTCADEACYGSRYQRVIDGSDRSVAFYRRAESNDAEYDHVVRIATPADIAYYGGDS